MKNEIINELKKEGIRIDGDLFANLPTMIENAIETVRSLGMEYWLKNTTAGPRIKRIVSKLA